MNKSRKECGVNYTADHFHFAPLPLREIFVKGTNYLIYKLHVLSTPSIL